MGNRQIWQIPHRVTHGLIFSIDSLMFAPVESHDNILGLYAQNNLKSGLSES